MAKIFIMYAVSSFLPRIYVKATPVAAGRDLVVYIAPCGRRLRNLSELDRFLFQTNSLLTCDLFCFDKSVPINLEFRCEQVNVFTDVRALLAVTTIII